MITYRRAEPSDIPVLVSMRLDMLEEENALSEGLKESVAENAAAFAQNGLAEDTYVMWVAADGPALVAMGGVNFFTLPPNDWCPTGRTAYISSMYTRPDYRRSGLAAAILARLVDEAKDRNCQRILLVATQAGRRLYEAARFEDYEGAMALFPFGILPQA